LARQQNLSTAEIDKAGQKLSSYIAEQERIKARNQEIQKLLTKADILIRAQRYLEPPNNCAVDTLKKVFKLEPDNKAAQQELQRIVNFMIQSAYDSLRQGSFDDAAEWQHQADQITREFSLSAKELTRLKETISRYKKETQERKEKTKQKIHDLLRQADRQILAKKVTTPSKDNALQTLRQVLTLDPTNKEVEQKLKTIVQRCSEFGSQALQKNNIDQAERFLRQGSRIAQEFDLDKNVLTSLAGQISDYRSRQKKVQATLEKTQSLLAEADRRIKARKLTTPEQENALVPLHQILRIDPGNKNVTQRVDSILNIYAVSGQRELEQNNPDKAQRLLQKGRKVAQEFKSLNVTTKKLDELAANIKTFTEQQQKTVQLKQTPDKISQILATAEEQITARKLTSPAGDNAVETLRQGLAESSDNQDILNKLVEIVHIYAVLAESALKHNKFNDADRHLRRGFAVAREFSLPQNRLKQLARKIDKSRKSQYNMLILSATKACNQGEAVSCENYAKMAGKLAATHGIPVQKTKDLFKKARKLKNEKKLFEAKLATARQACNQGELETCDINFNAAREIALKNNFKSNALGQLQEQLTALKEKKKKKRRIIGTF
jgi:hypothetical protein